MNTYYNFWNGEKKLPNLLNIENMEELSIIEHKKGIAIKNKLILENTNSTTFNLELIKRIHALVFNNIY